MKTTALIKHLILALLFIAFITSCDSGKKDYSNSHYAEEDKSDALDALDSWWSYRVYPNDRIDMAAYSDAYKTVERLRAKQTKSFSNQWEAKGPKNFGGRTLCLAFNPQNVNTIYAGSASGGLWRSRSAGIGANAWEYIPTGFPILGVGAIVISPTDSNTIYIGTGEVYNYQNTGTGIVDRTTRGTYGIGILKSTDGGLTWTKSLDWAYDDLKGVQDMKMNPLDPNTILAATSEGLYKTSDGGQNWVLKHSVLMTTDIEYKPGDTSIVYIASGNSGTPGSGIYKSVDGAENFTKLSNGLPASYTGKTLLDIPANWPNMVFASVADQFQQIGLFRSMDDGQTWTNINSDDISLYQGWFSHDIAVMPSNPNHMLWAGVDVYQSKDAGANFSRKSYWFNWDFSATPIGGPEGPGDYVHADVHRVYVKPGSDSIFYLATDGGIFITFDAGENFSGHNGQYQTVQFYADVSNALLDTNFFIGGLQDNATAVYEGNLAWRRVIGGDGMCTAVDPSNSNIVYASAQRLNMFKSTDGGINFSNIAPGVSSSNTAFNGPFVLSPTAPKTIYAGREFLYRSTNGGNSWQTLNAGQPLNGQAILSIAIAPSDPNTIYCSTVALDLSSRDLLKSSDGGQNWQSVKAGLPDRIIMDIGFSSSNSDVAYVALSGFGTDHVYKTTDGAQSWFSSSMNLPNVPHNTLIVDDLNEDYVYVGNDFGIFASTDGGNSWVDYNLGLNDATLIMSMTYNPITRKIRLGTHGKGMYEGEMITPGIANLSAENGKDINIHPNPVKNKAILNFGNLNANAVWISNAEGKTVMNQTVNNQSSIELDLSDLQRGTYILRVFSNDATVSKKIVKQ